MDDAQDLIGDSRDRLRLKLADAMHGMQIRLGHCLDLQGMPPRSILASMMASASRDPFSKNFLKTINFNNINFAFQADRA